MPKSVTIEISPGYLETRSPITYREFEQEKARQEAERLEALRNSRWGLMSEIPDYVRYPFTTRLDWSQIAINSARFTGARLALLGIQGDTVIDSNRIDLVTHERIVTRHIVRPNQVEYMVTAVDENQYRLFKDEYDMEVEMGLMEKRLTFDIPDSGLGFWRSNGLGRLLSGNHRGAHII